MTGREKIEAAFSPDGTNEIPAVICYEGIYIRDHWPELTPCPWWYQFTPHVEEQMAWRRQVIEKTGQDWFVLPHGYTHQEQQEITIEVRPEGVFKVNRRSGERRRLEEPRIGGWSASGSPQSVRPAYWAETPDEIDALIPLPPTHPVDDGSEELPARMLAEFGPHLFPIRHVSAPLWSCYNLWGFEGLMIMIATRPDLVKYACGRYLAARLREVREAAARGAAGIWIEDCMTDMIHPEAFAALNVPFLQALVEEIRALGMKSIHYFCGNPAGKWRSLLEIAADALSLEESKKGFRIEIEDVVGLVQGRRTLLGNLDAIGVLQDGTEATLRAEIKRQIAAGWRNGGRFIMSLGSPVTPGTPVSRVRLYCDLVHELGRRP